jgi:hypothetical protein
MNRPYNADGATNQHLSGFSFFNRIIKEKGKPVERRGRKANGSKARESYDSQVARDNSKLLYRTLCG